jgi:ligand-binding sensor domain-containing protein/two-component sensor histidine kinase
MPDCKAIKLIFCIYFLTGISAHAQFKFEKAIVISKDNGLPVNDIRCIRKSADGFVWIGTSDGLCRFDGQLVKIFREGGDLRHSLFENAINSVLPVKNYVWIATSQGVSVLNTKDYTFRHYQFNGNKKADKLARKFDQTANILFTDRFGNIWIGTRNRGVCMYDETKDDFRFFNFSREKYPPLVPSLGYDNAVLSLEASRTNDSIIWGGTTAGLQEINRFSGDVKLYTFPKKNKDYQIALNVFRRLYHHDDGLLYVGSWAAGVNVFDPVTKTFTPLVVINETGKKILNSTISNISRKTDHEIWISTGKGLALYDTKLKEVTWSKFNNAQESEFYSMIFIDEANRVWNFDINGVSYFDPTMQQFSRYSFKQFSGPDWAFAFYILSDKSGNNITVCPRFSDGVYHFNKLKKEWSKVPFPQQKDFKREIEAVKGFAQLPSGDYILSNDKGIFLYSEKNKKITRFRSTPAFSPTRRGEIFLDHSGNMWLSDDIKGLIKWNPQTGQYVFYNNYLLQGDSKRPTGRLGNFFEDSHSNIWFQMTNGFGVYIAAGDSIVSFSYALNEKNSFPFVSSFSEDKTGKVWVSGGDGWLGYALSNDPEKGIIYKLNIKNKGVPGSLLHLATDTHGEVWGFTLTELVKINAGDLSFTTYSFDYGVSEPDFYHFSFLPSGEMIFGGRNEIIIANPLELKRNKEIPVPYIAEVQVVNQPYDFMGGNGSPLKLRYKQNFFSIGFSAVAYTMPKDVKFRYRLKGFDDWTEVAGRRFANYTNVPGGKYSFQLQAANNEGIWNKKILEMPIRIAIPFWLTGWFRIAVVLLIALGTYSLYRYRVNQLRKKQKMKSEYDKKLANVEMSALLAQMNPHFLFNSLNSIDSYIIRNESKKASEYLNNFARLMRLILQNSRSNYISLKDELEALELYLQMESLRFKNKFSYAIDVDETLDTCTIVIPPMLIQPYVENAIWHGLMHKTNGEEGKVELILCKSEDNLLCIIRDNGIGRKRAAELKEQKVNNHKRSMGMQITEDRIEIINKLYNINASVHIYDVEDELGGAKGTRVELTIPV